MRAKLRVRRVNPAIAIALGVGIVPATAAAQCPTLSNAFSRWSSSQEASMATAHGNAADNLPPGDACIAVLDSAASGITRAANTCGIWWAPNSGPLYGNPGAMPSNLGPDNALDSRKT